MDFKILHGDIKCDCVSGTAQDIASLFAIKTNRNKLRDEDFKSHWDKGYRDDGCDNICLLKGKSMNMVNNGNVEELKAKFRQAFPLNDFSPSYRPFFTVIKFGENCGHVKKTPTKVFPDHYTFYKCDTFTVVNVQMIECKKLHV